MTDRLTIEYDTHECFYVVRDAEHIPVARYRSLHDAEEHVCKAADERAGYKSRYRPGPLAPSEVET